MSVISYIGIFRNTIRKKYCDGDKKFQIYEPFSGNIQTIYINKKNYDVLGPIDKDKLDPGKQSKCHGQDSENRNVSG